MSESRWTPHVTVATVVYENNQYLLVEEKTASGIVFNQPAGHWEPGETLMDAAARETLEETGYSVTVAGLLGLSQLNTADRDVYLRVTFVAEQPLLNADATLDNDIIAAHWLTYEEIIERKARLRSPLVLNDIERHRSGRILPLDLLFQAEIA